jgi:hypothetical protein
VRQVKGLLNHTRPVGGRKVSPGMVRSGSRCGGTGGGGGGRAVFGQTCALAYLCCSLDLVSHERSAGVVVVQGSAPRAPPLAPLLPSDRTVQSIVASLLVPTRSLAFPLPTTSIVGLHLLPHALLTTFSLVRPPPHAPSPSLRRTPPSPAIFPSRTA